MICDYEIYNLPHIAALRQRVEQAREAVVTPGLSPHSEPPDTKAVAAYLNASQDYVTAALDACELLEKINVSIAEGFALPETEA